jgi:hypothetical protein
MPMHENQGKLPQYTAQYCMMDSIAMLGALLTAA